MVNGALLIVKLRIMESIARQLISFSFNGLHKPEDYSLYGDGHGAMDSGWLVQGDLVMFEVFHTTFEIFKYCGKVYIYKDNVVCDGRLY